MHLAVVRSIHMGKAIERVDDKGRIWTSAIVKPAVQGGVQATLHGLQGDEQADRKHHGGPDKAVCAYPADHQPYWSNQLGRRFGGGDLGENLSLAGLTETDVAIGDVHRVGGCVMQVSQPRSPCWKLARRWGVKDLPLRVESTGFTGWYYRVLVPGTINPDEPVTVVDRPHPRLSVAATTRCRRGVGDVELLRELVACAPLSGTWRRDLARRLERV